MGGQVKSSCSSIERDDDLSKNIKNDTRRRASKNQLQKKYSSPLQETNKNESNRKGEDFHLCCYYKKITRARKEKEQSLK